MTNEDQFRLTILGMVFVAVLAGLALFSTADSEAQSVQRSRISFHTEHIPDRDCKEATEVCPYCEFGGVNPCYHYVMLYSDTDRVYRTCVHEIMELLEENTKGDHFHWERIEP
jgi:hypothetical protein